MIRALFVATAAALLATATSASAQDKVATGKALFTSQKCVLCHSLEGQGNKKGPLDGVGAKLKADDIRQWLTDAAAMRVKTKSMRNPQMKDYSSLPKDQIEALVAFLVAQKAQPADTAR